MARPNRNSCTAYALRNYSQKDVLNVQVTEASAALPHILWRVARAPPQIQPNSHSEPWLCLWTHL